MSITGARHFCITFNVQLAYWFYGTLSYYLITVLHIFSVHLTLSTTCPVQFDLNKGGNNQRAIWCRLMPKCAMTIWSINVTQSVNYLTLSWNFTHLSYYGYIKFMNDNKWIILNSVSFQFNAFGDCFVFLLRSEAQFKKKKDAPVHTTSSAPLLPIVHVFFSCFAWFLYKNTPECLCVLSHIPHQVPYSTLLLTWALITTATLWLISSRCHSMWSRCNALGGKRESLRGTSRPHIVSVPFSFFFHLFLFVFQLMSGPESIHMTCREQMGKALV